MRVFDDSVVTAQIRIEGSTVPELFQNTGQGIRLSVLQLPLASWRTRVIIGHSLGLLTDVHVCIEQVELTSTVCGL